MCYSFEDVFECDDLLDIGTHFTPVSLPFVSSGVPLFLLYLICRTGYILHLIHDGIHSIEVVRGIGLDVPDSSVSSLFDLASHADSLTGSSRVPLQRPRPRRGGGRKKRK